MKSKIWFLFLFLFFLASPLLAEDQRIQKKSSEDFTQLSLEDLLNTEIISVSKKKQSLLDAPSAVYVITSEEIRRSGATSIPEALRLAPGLHVGKTNGGAYAISARGFQYEFANKLLVLVDGRTIYQPNFNGVLWNNQEVFLEDVDRIEVIRGPGGTLWGANAVNGVINIITKHSKDTKGFLGLAGGGKEERGFFGLRYGGETGNNDHWRIYGKYTNRDEGFFPGLKAGDDFKTGIFGGRADLRLGAKDQLLLQGDWQLFEEGRSQAKIDLNQIAIPVVDPIRGMNFNFLSRWEHRFSEKQDLSFQSYYSYSTYNTPVSDIVPYHLFDFDLQHRFRLPRQEIIWGGGYRLIHIGFEKNAGILSIRTGNRHVFSGFVQDEITAVKDRLKLIVGSKFEHNSFSGFEIQPSFRFIATPHRSHRIWGAVSRVVRTPSDTEKSLVYNTEVVPLENAPPLVVQIQPNPLVKPEKLIAFELGYRAQLRSNLFFDVAGFYNRYSNLMVVHPLDNSPPSFVADPVPHLVQGITYLNELKGSTYGGELALNWQVFPRWNLKGSYSFVKMNFDANLANVGYAGADPEANSQHHFNFWSRLDLPLRLELDLGLRFVGEIPQDRVSRYVDLDARLAWKPTKNLELAVIGRNLLKNHHLEFLFDDANQRLHTQNERAVWGKLTWKFQ